MTDRIAYLGPRGSFAEAAVRALTDGRDVELVAAASVQAALDAARDGTADLALVPIENSVEGSVSVTLDELANGKRLVIVDEVVIPVRFALLARPGTALADVRRVSTHPHAQAQVRHWLAEHLPEAHVIPAMSTAAAAAAVAEEQAFDAAVAQPIAAEIYGLDVLADDIQDNDDAYTRFILVRLPGEIPAPTGADKTTLSLYMKQDEPGALLAILTEFAVRGVNLTRIESRPTKKALGDYYFSVDIEGHVADARVSEALMGLHRVCLDVRYLGSYARHDGKQPVLRPGVTDADFGDARQWLDKLKGKQPVRYFVTGAAGFIGSHFVRELMAGTYGVEPSVVTVFDKLTYAGNLENLASVSSDPRFSFVQGDICDGDLLDRVLPGHDVVVNFAAETHVDRSIHGPQDFVVTNVVGTQTLLDACLRHGIPRTVHIGTDEVYGSIDEGSWDENEPLRPNSPYSAAKAAAELLVRAYYVTYGLNVSSTRCSNNYGPYQFPEKVIPLFVTNLIDGAKVPLYGDGLNVRDWLHVDDHCRGIALVVEKGQPGESYNIGGGLELNNRELTERVLEAMGADWSMVQPVEDRKGHDRRYSVNDGKLRALGYAPQHRFEDGLAETVQWYKDNEAWWRPLKAKAAIG